MSERKCEVPGCERKHEGRGLCAMHWARWDAGTLDGIYLSRAEEKNALLHADNFRVVSLPLSIEAGLLTLFRNLPAKKAGQP